MCHIGKQFNNNQNIISKNLPVRVSFNIYNILFYLAIMTIIIGSKG